MNDVTAALIPSSPTLVSGSEFRSPCTVLHFRSCSPSPVASAEMCNTNDLPRMLQPLTWNCAQLSPTPATKVQQGEDSLCYPLPLSLLNVWFVPHTLCRQQKRQGPGICLKRLQKCLSSLNMLGAERGPDSHHRHGVTSLQLGRWDGNQPGRQGLNAWLIYCIKI